MAVLHIRGADRYGNILMLPFQTLVLGQCLTGIMYRWFPPFGQFGQTYSYWPVIAIPYNLPPWLCMKRQYMFLNVLIPGLKAPKGKFDVYL